MTRIDIPSGCTANSDDRTRILVTIVPGSDDLPSVVDEAGRFGQTLSGGTIALYLASHTNGDENNG